MYERTYDVTKEDVGSVNTGEGAVSDGTISVHVILLVGGMRLSGRSCNVMPRRRRLEMNTGPASKMRPLFPSASPDHCQMLEEEVM